ncbi:hypothetical protein [Microbacterium sp. P03]|uniref:hypothetical protein n=1 Tax=Microbacterium sp. P03 TaxID=3366946 RepID=UPI00374697FC
MRIKTRGFGVKRASRRVAERVDTVFGRSLRMMSLRGPKRTVGVVGIYREAQPIAALVEELSSSRHDVVFRLGAMGDIATELRDETSHAHLTAGKFQNLNVLTESLADVDWLLIIDDDVIVPRHFLDQAIELCERLDLSLAQPAQTRLSNANWPLTKRRFLTIARDTQFVEIGPVTLIRADAMRKLLPFPTDLRYGWGLDFEWAQVMTDFKMRMGVIDSLAVIHASRAVASTYSWDAAQKEGQEYLRGVPHLPKDVAEGNGLRFHRTIPRPVTR